MKTTLARLSPQRKQLDAPDEGPPPSDSLDDDEGRPDLPADVLLSLAISLLSDRERLISAQRTRIEVLEHLLRAAASTWMPAGTVIQ